MISITDVTKVKNAKLTLGIPTSDPDYAEKQVARASILGHMHKCSICRHPKKEEIEQKILDLTLTEHEIKQYGITMTIVRKHRDMFQIWKTWEKRADDIWFSNVIKANSRRTKLSTRIALGEQAFKAAQSDTANTNVQVIQQAIMLMNNKENKQLTGGMPGQDNIPQAQLIDANNLTG